ncbi:MULTISPECIES: tryptophan transporter [Neobacillus]|uniref:Tryptophan transporter n=1 Tax=Neobacillus rhizophilus TaxID=2833579 RepID=A0A942YUQ5_9BACI|nr:MULTISPECIES: tryptophan transporter [Neobacillus]MBS4212220.1 tryptophan transporter [Neobacillus rhizophilus]MBU8915655.1 tryptophan transporter [Bacillus sp. FJAT-29953]
MKTKNLVILALLAAIGFVLHAVMPAFLTIKPDMMLAMMFLGIILIPEIKSVMLLAIVTGVLSAITTQFPGGQFPNIIDKPVTALVFFGLFLALKKYRNSIVSVGALTAIGTIVSGTVFLTSAYFLVGLPGPFAALFGVAVLPAAAINTVTMVILYPIAQSIAKRTKSSTVSVIEK